MSGSKQLALREQRPPPSPCAQGTGSGIAARRETSTLWVGLEPPEKARGTPGGMAFDSGVEALAALRLLSADLVFVGTDIRDMVPGEFARRMRCRLPRQHWVLVSPELDVAGEIEARSMGAVAVLDSAPTEQTYSGDLTGPPGGGQWQSVRQCSQQSVNRHSRSDSEAVSTVLSWTRSTLNED